VSTAALAEQASIESPPRRGDTATERAIMVRWRNAAGTARERVAFEVEAINTTDASIDVQLSIVAHDTTEGEVEEALGARRIPAKSTIAVPVPVQRIPLQTTGVATPVAVTATYERPTAVVG